MTRFGPIPRIALGACIVFGLTGFALLWGDYRPFKVIPLGNESELKATVEGGLADIRIARGSGSNLLSAEVDRKEGESVRGFVEYSSRGGIGYSSVDLNITDEDEHRRSKKKGSGVDFSSEAWNLLYTDRIPISFDIGLGLGEVDIDLSGLNVKDFDLTTGASSVRLAFTEPNRGSMKKMTIEAGLSRFRAHGLGYAKFHRLHFEGGMGQYTLDFSGPLKGEVDVDAEVGLGSLTIVIPRGTGARIIYDKNWICDFDIDDEFAEQEDGTFQSAEYASAQGRINLRVEAGFGAVNIRRD